METERGSPVPREAETPKKEVQLRVTPSEVKFLDTLAGRVYRLPITVHNLGRCNQKIRFQEPLKPQVIHLGVLEQDFRTFRALRTLLHLGARSVPESRRPVPAEMGPGLTFPGSRDFGLSVFTYARLFVLFCVFTFCLALGDKVGKSRSRTSQLLGLESREKGFHVCLLTAQNFCLYTVELHQQNSYSNKHLLCTWCAKFMFQEAVPIFWFKS